MKLRSWRLSAIACAVALCVLPSVPAAAAAPLVLKISHQFPANTDFRDQVAQKFAKEVEKRTHGEVTFQIYPGASLYKATQQFDAMANGALDMSVYPLAYSGGKLPATNLTLMPALISSYKQAYDWEERRSASGSTSTSTSTASRSSPGSGRQAGSRRVTSRS